ncbi:MAG: hypothetical protein WC655_04095 [Candidatus Hydrogenedentales bacterium]|jgi:co-chaperonin GroES (HSP10)
MTITKLLGNRIIIRRIEEELAAPGSRIFLPVRARNKAQSFLAEVVRLGSGPKVPGQVSIGDRVTLLRTGSQKLDDGTEIVSVLDILAIHQVDIEEPPEKPESYTPAEVENAIEFYLRHTADVTMKSLPILTTWAERVLRWHLKQLEAKRAMGNGQ